jgi:glycosyltransferase involved in cell wall biosynthesis
MIMLDEVRRSVDQFDVLHFHVDVVHAPLVRDFADRTLTTLHGRLDLADLAPFYAAFRDLPLASISKDQQGYLSRANWVGTVYHGLPRDLLQFHSPPAGYLAFLGRISPEKGPDQAIEIAARSGMPLKVAAKVDRADAAYWEEKIRPMIGENPNVEFIGEIGEYDKARFLGEAAALLFPIDWPEPFGLVMIEAMACGTPVIAYRRGSVPEVIEENVSGFVVGSMEEAVAAVRRVPDLNRVKVRAAFERRFTAERMARDYVDIYEHLLAARERRAQFAMINGRHCGPQAIRTASGPMESYHEVTTVDSSKSVFHSSESNGRQGISAERRACEEESSSLRGTC